MKKVKTSNTRNILTTVVAVIMMIGLILILFTINNNKEKTIAVVKVKDEIYPNGLIPEGNLEKYEMPLTEYNNNKSKGEYLLWDERQECIEKYSTIYTKKYICKGDYQDTRPIKNEWLTEAEDGDIFISIPYDKNDAFGNILTPGDYIKVAITYNKQEANADGFGSSLQEKDEILFEKIQVVDMLNNKGNSIYDYYTDLLSMSMADREAELRNESFLTNVSPTQILLKVGAKEEFGNYVRVCEYQSLHYTYGLYPRNEEDTILSQFGDLTRQITAAQTQVNTTNVSGSDRKSGDN